MHLNNRLTRFAIAMGVLGAISSQIPLTGNTAVADGYSTGGGDGGQGIKLATGIGLLSAGVAVFGGHAAAIGSGAIGGGAGGSAITVVPPAMDASSEALLPASASDATSAPSSAAPDEKPSETSQANLAVPGVPSSQIKSLTSTPGSSVSVSTSTGQIVSVSNDNGTVTQESTGSSDGGSDGSSAQ